MDNDKRAMTWNEFVRSGFDGKEYKYPDFEGDVLATLDCKRWGSGNNIIAYFTLYDGRKILTSAWNERNYLGLAEIPAGSKVKLTFRKSAKGATYLRGVVLIQNEW